MVEPCLANADRWSRQGAILVCGKYLRSNTNRWMAASTLGWDMADSVVTNVANIESIQAQLNQVSAERDALQARVARLEQLEQERRARREAKRTKQQKVSSEPLDYETFRDKHASISFDPKERTQRLIDPAELYLDLLKNCLMRLPFGERPHFDFFSGQLVDFDPKARVEGMDWPSEAETMAGLQRLDNVQQCVVDVLRNQVPGDLIETGVWRGGITILMRAVLKAYGNTERIVWAADSFAGLPVPNAEKYAADAGLDISVEAGFEVLAVPVEAVQANFARYGLLDDQVRFLVGWFRDTLPTAPIERLAVLRLDGDLYESTMDALTSLYPKLSVGGYLIIDDYFAWESCAKAVNDYRELHEITEPIVQIDWNGAYWQRQR